MSLISWSFKTLASLDVYVKQYSFLSWYISFLEYLNRLQKANDFLKVLYLFLLFLFLKATGVLTYSSRLLFLITFLHFNLQCRFKEYAFYSMYVRIFKLKQVLLKYGLKNHSSAQNTGLAFPLQFISKWFFCHIQLYGLFFNLHNNLLLSQQSNKEYVMILLLNANHTRE